jgi:hypothetical protein
MNKLFVLLALPALICAAQARAADYPDVKSGLWSTSVNMTGQGTHTGTMCMNNDVLKAQAERAKNPGGPCKVLSENRSGSTFTSKSQCTFSGVTHTTTAVTTMTGNTAMHAEVSSDDGKMHMVSDSKYVSACPAGMVPGDFVDEQGHKVNLIAPPPAASAGVPPDLPK